MEKATLKDPTVPDARVRLASFDRPRDAWPFAPEIVPLNHGSFGAVPSEVVAAQAELRARADRSPVGWFPRLAEFVEAARAAVAPFVGARPNDLVFVPNASAAATVVFNSLRLSVGDEILVSDHGYGAVTMGAQRLARRFGARVRKVHVPLAADAETVESAFADALASGSVRLVVIDQITSSTARRFPIHAIAQRAHEAGARVLVDGAHGPGLIEHAAAEASAADWWFGNLHKWPCAPRGAAVLVTTAHDRDELWPLIDSWSADEAYPRRFDSQGTIDATAYLTAPASIDFIEREFGWHRTRGAMAQMADRGALLIAEAMQPHVDGPALVDVAMPVPSMRLVRLPAQLGKAREAADALRMRLIDLTGIEAAFTSFAGAGYFRLSAHLYTQDSDFYAFVERGIPEILSLAAASR